MKIEYVVKTTPSLLNPKIKTGIFKYNDIDNNFWCNKEIDNINEVKEALKNSEKQAKNILITDNFYILHQFIDKDVRVFSFIEKKNTDFDIVLKYLLIFVSYFLLSDKFINVYFETFRDFYQVL